MGSSSDQPEEIAESSERGKVLRETYITTNRCKFSPCMLLNFTDAYDLSLDQNECLEPGICHSNATCANTEGSYQCTCMLSYTGDGKNCTWYKGK